VVAWGRVTTATFRKLKAVPGHKVSEWWLPFAEELHNDPEFLYLYDLRNDVEKAGTIGQVSGNVHIKHLDWSELAPLMANPPPYAKGFFMGDQWGGSGWQIELPDGRTEKFYVKIPADIAVSISISMHFTEATTSQHRPPPERPIEDVLTRYVDYLESILGSAIQAFGSRSA
jgi:hypothetical protein